ncbi:MDR family MFS transporter [Frigidibacter sp. MR17.24]|uniref:MDR family MFS transporter n=1 Tax=Frigidibacter sp. MR17.24 TaxID=3127345 RepID=UPI003012ED62
MTDVLSSETPPALTRRRRLVVFCFLMLSLFMATLDNQIVSTALPTIVGEFGALDRFGWIGSAYLLAMSATMPVYGKLGDLFGRKYVMMTAITIFTLGSLACGMAWSMNSLIAARVLQGLGGGGIMVSIFSINADLFEPRERARYQSFSSLMVMAAGSIGPFLGGTLSEAFGWRSIFLVNLPIGIVAVTGLFLLLPLKKPGRSPRIDVPGAALLALAIASLVLYADAGQLFGGYGSAKALGLLVLSAVAIAVWVAVERRAAEPVIPPGLFANPTFPLMLLVTLTSGGIAIGMVNYHALFLQMTTGLSPAHAGLFFIAVTGGIAAGSLSAGRIIEATGRVKPVLITGLVCNVAMLTAMAQLHAGTPLWVIAAVLLVQGIAVGLGQQAPIIGVQSVAPVRDVGAATGAVTLARMAGASLAISIYGAIIAASLAGQDTRMAGGGDMTRLTPEAMAALPAAARATLAGYYSSAFHTLYLTAAGIAAVGLIAALMLRPVVLAAGRPAVVARRPDPARTAPAE